MSFFHFIKEFINQKVAAWIDLHRFFLRQFKIEKQWGALYFLWYSFFITSWWTFFAISAIYTVPMIFSIFSPKVRYYLSAFFHFLKSWFF